MKNITFIPVSGAASIERVAALAASIWREHYVSIIGAAQVEYMIGRFQSAAAIAEQVRSGYRYYLVQDGADNDIGYFAAVPRAGLLFLSKIYFRSECRGRGCGRKTVAFLEDMARGEKLTAIELTVNKKNLNSIEAYKKLGFVVRSSTVADIGNGFVMDDYIMRKVLS